jgi:hypothetical protein
MVETGLNPHSTYDPVTTITSLSSAMFVPYCDYHHLSIYDKPYNIECETATQYDGQEYPIPGTCWNYEYKGKREWTQKDDADHPALAGERMKTATKSPCENCSNTKCANSVVALWWDRCVESGFTLFPQKEGEKE